MNKNSAKPTLEDADTGSAAGHGSATVSVICRTIGRPTLARALDSVIAQSWRPLELVLIDASGSAEASKQLPEAADTSVRSVAPETPLSRPQAANAGLDAATGRYLMFLDDDDWIDPPHIEHLVEELSSASGCLVAYSSARQVNEQELPSTKVFEQDFDPLLLKRDNYIPIHCALFDRHLLELGCRFDESFDIYEDWDFWLQCMAHTEFLHTREITAYYRKGGGSGTTFSREHEKYRDSRIASARAALFDKWLPDWSGSDINAMLATMDQSGYVAKLESELLHSKQAREELARELEYTKAELDHTRNTIKNLEEHLSLVLNSSSWKMTRPYRWAGHRLKSMLRPASSPDVSQRPGSGARNIEDTKRRYAEDAHRHLAEWLDTGQSMEIPRATSPRLSIILVVYNQCHLTLICLESLVRNCDVPMELILVDNASSDRTSEMLERTCGAILIRNQENEGFVHAVNTGAEHASGDYLLLLNNDAMLHPGALSSALSVFDDHPDAGAVGGKIILLDEQLQEAGSIIWQDGGCLGYGRGCDPEAPEFNFRRQVDYCSGAFLMTPRRVFEQLGGFDTDYAPAYYEESDYCIRLNKAGLKTIYEPRAVITHYEFASSGGFSSASKLQTEHRRILCRKHADYLDSRPLPDVGSTLDARALQQGCRVLFIDDRVPHANLGSGYPRCRDLVRELCDAGASVTFYPLTIPHDDWASTYETLPREVEVMLGHGPGGLTGFLEQRLNHYDHIIVSRIHNINRFSESITQLRKRHDPLELPPIIYDAEAVTAPREAERMRLSGKTVTEKAERRMVEREIESARLADTIVTVSDNEAGLYREAGYRNTEVISHKIEPALSENDFRERQDLLFVGALREDESPNVDSLFWFAESVLPGIIERLGEDVRLLAVGDNLAPSLLRIQSPNIRFLGRQDDLTHFYNTCRVFVAPTRFAAGIPHKLHESAARGLPSVATPLLARQLGWQDGEQLLVGESADAFAAQCATLYTDRSTWERIRIKAAESVSRDCSPDRFREGVRKLLGVNDRSARSSSSRRAKSGT